MTIAVVEYTFVLGPMDPREDAVEVLQVRMVVPDPVRRFCHSEFRVAARHAFHAHQTHALAVQMECAVSGFKFANAKDCRKAMGFTCSRDREFKTIKIWMIEMPKLHLRQHNLHGLRLSCPPFNRGQRPCAPVQNRQAGCFIHDAVGSPAAPVLSARVSDIAGDRDGCLSAVEIGSGFDVYTFHEYFRSNEELYRPEHASVVRPVAGASARQHVFIERIVYANGNGVGFSPLEQRCNVESERGVALASVFSDHLAINPNSSCVKDRLELNPYCKGSPVR